MNKAATTTLLPRQRARLAAVQALYQMELAGSGLESVLREFRDERFDAPDDAEGKRDKVDRPHFERVLRGVVEHQADIDKAVNKVLRTGWSLDRLDTTVRALLRAGAFELYLCKDVPLRVALNEYVEIARDFFDGDEPGFINGVLDKLGRDWRPDEAK